ncbi:hypothetical protein PPTG_18829 [Phytophthora nicotianae INRA-310]|uniref:Transposase Tc1-like domain-containing protein n=1 Tax=Phytophthora nicotianae (strain INRA-310) TaxID=761204 RepID=W2PFZ0_PHYN3|nr:hypothetical protein PPTG_18829 [Phytophthora nicotianae INRA-310]ETM99560.1 hypothetical protein PPTG_18829 [Phytophthora nicotianae INRA-310]
MTKPNLSDLERKVAIDELLRINNIGTLPRGAYPKVATGMGRDPTTISAIWKRYAVTVGAAVLGGEWISKIKKNSGRKRKNRDEVREKLASVYIEDNTVERRAAVNAGLSRYMVRQAVKEGVLARRTTFVKSALTPNNKLRPRQAFVPCFRRRKASFPGVKEQAVRLSPETGMGWVGKVGIWSFTETYEAKRRSKNRDKGALCTRNIDSVDRDVYRDYLLEKVFPAIKAKWPRKDRHQIFFVQQDNAKPHALHRTQPSSPLEQKVDGTSDCSVKRRIRQISMR